MPETPSPAEVALFMRQYGGSFVRAIAAAYMVGDETNRETLVRAFETYWREYGLALLTRRAREAA
jgi:predicted RNA polymerase sigma factor